MDVLLGYVIVFLLSFLALTGLPATIVTGLLARWFGVPFHAGAFVGALIVWFGIASVWTSYFGEPLPVLLAGLLVAFKVGHLIASGHDGIGGLNPLARVMIGTEALALPVVVIAAFIATQQLALV